MNTFKMFGHDFIIEKTEDKNYKVSTKKGYIFVCKDKTKMLVIKKAQELLNKHGEAEFVRRLKSSIKNKVKNRFFQDTRIKALFLKIFHEPIYKFLDTMIYVFTGLYGLDAIRFDSWLRTPEGISTYDYLNQKYGKKAVKLIKKLI